MPGFELIGDEERAAINEIFDRGGVLFRYGFEAQRKNVFKVAEFEREFARKLGCNHAQAVTSGTAALRVALAPLELKPGDEVITQCFTFVATPEAIMEAGARPVLTEVDETLNMDPEDLERKITPRTRAIIPVHMLGAAARMDEIMAIAKKRGIPVIEDSCQAPGSTYRGKKTGAIGLMGCFSFDPVKTLTTGEGGMVVTNDRDVYNKLCWFADHGHMHVSGIPRGEDTKEIRGFDFRMNEIQGAMGLVQLSRIDSILARQRANKSKIRENIKRLPGIRFRMLADPEGDGGDTLVFFTPSREIAVNMNSHLVKNAIETKILPSALGWHFAGNWGHMLRRYRYYNVRNLASRWPKADNILHSAIAIPIYVKMSDEQIQRISRAIIEAGQQYLR
ncbi:MAG: DegT/DnrJ/EryC1/StrS family aminotransferase [Chloroflexi bacterium]|nr:DegT/DnrJ/EryC1/StrS family aminotransferase [Chloroflexota bacterium]